MTFDEINEKTGFADGDLFQNAEEVKRYFTTHNLYTIFGECALTTTQLEAMAEEVIRNRWHMSE